MKPGMSSKPDRRTEIRYSIFGEFPARMFNEATQAEVSFLAVDISHRGLGLLMTPSPEEGQRLRLDFTEGPLSSMLFICRHVHEIMDRPMSGFESMRRCGLELAEDQQAAFDLIEFFARFDSVMIGD